MLTLALELLNLVLLVAASPSSPAVGDNGWYAALVEAAAPLVHGLVAAGSEQCENVKNLFGLTYEQVQVRNTPDTENALSIDLITPSGPHKFNISSENVTIQKSTLYDSSKPLIVLIHGFMQSSGCEMVKEISNALLERKAYNVMALDGGEMINIMYFRSTTYVRFIGEKLAQVLAGLVKDSDLNPKTISIVGHSLGAHIAGISGKEFQRITGSRIARITGLDPAGPCFSEEGVRLQKGDAEYVDIIHTDGGLLGLKEPIGDQDFFPNGGSIQPGCGLPPCCHSRAWQLYAESVRNPLAFPAVRCSDWGAFQSGACGGETSYMGLDTEPSSAGSYFLRTADSAPYGLEGRDTVIQVSS